MNTTVLVLELSSCCTALSSNRSVEMFIISCQNFSDFSALQLGCKKRKCDCVEM